MAEGLSKGVLVTNRIFAKTAGRGRTWSARRYSGADWAFVYHVYRTCGVIALGRRMYSARGLEKLSVISGQLSVGGAFPVGGRSSPAPMAAWVLQSRL